MTGVDFTVRVFDLADQLVAMILIAAMVFGLFLIKADLVFNLLVLLFLRG